MNADAVMTMTYQSLSVMLAIASPLLLVTLVVGLIVSVFQAATQINEMTLSFIPKLLAVGATLAILGRWLITTMVDHIQALLSHIPTMTS